MVKEAIDVDKDATQLIVNIVTSLYKIMELNIGFLIRYCATIIVIPVMAEAKIKQFLINLSVISLLFIFIMVTWAQ